MQKHNITKLLGIQGVLVKNIKEYENYLEINIETKRKFQKCPSCKYLTNKVHDYRVQRIQHISIGKRLTFLVLNKRRYCCSHCGKKFYENYSFLQKYFRKTNAVFENVCDNLKSLKNFKTIAKDNNISTPTVVRYMHYNFYLSNKHNFELPEKIGIDEFKGNCNCEKYQLHIFDLDTRKTIDIVKSRKYDDLEAYFSSFSLEQRCKVKVVSMDLYSPFKRIIKDKFYHALIVADCFHFTKLVIQALDELRLNLWRNTKGNEKRYFKNLKLSLAKDASKLTEKGSEKLLYAFEFSPILKYAYQLKQQFLDIKKLTSYDEKEKAFRKWLDDAESSTISELKKPVKTLRQWHEYISNSFRLNISNGPVEGKNNLIKTLKRISFGFRNLTNFKEKIILCSL